MSRAATTALYLVAFLCACSSDPPPFNPKGGAGDLAGCSENPKAQPGPRSILTVVVDPTFAGKAVVFGEPFPLPNGGTLTVSNLRFYVSDFQIVMGGDELVPVDIVSPDGKPLPYNVHLVNAASTSEMTFQIAAPAGDYTGMSFIFGLNDSCQGRDPGASLPPLTFQSQMTWPRPFGFLFLRYEGTVTGADQDAPLSAVAMGGFPGYVWAPRINATGTFRVNGTGDTVHLTVALDEISRAASLPLDPNATPPPIPSPAGEIEAGDHLLQNANTVSIFSLTTGS